MKNRCKWFLHVLSVSFFLHSCSNQPTRDLYPEQITGGFELLPAEKTGVDFSNTIKESTYFNHYYYSQIYLGSGVAIGDLNNDGLSDVYLTSNLGKNKLFLKYCSQFKDISNILKIIKNEKESFNDENNRDSFIVENKQNSFIFNNE